MKDMKERKGDSNPENCMSGISKRKQSRIMRKGTAIFVAALMTMMAATPLLFGTTEKADVGAGADVGAKYDHEQFGNDSGCYNAFSGTLPFTNERIFCYRFDGGDGGDNAPDGGHGTATTSILVGNCDDSPLENESDEDAPNEADVNVQGGNTSWHNVSLTFGAAANVLMVFEWDYDKTLGAGGFGGEYNHMFNDALNDSGCTGSYDTWNISWNDGSYMYSDETHYQPNLSDMTPYDLVLFFYEDGNIYPEATFPNANAEHIKDYLEANGSVGMFAHEWRYGAGNNTDLMLNYFFATTIVDDGADDANNARGAANDPISHDWSGSDFDLTDDHRWEDRIEGDVNIFYWNRPGPPSRDKWMAIRSNENNRSWKSTWFGFCITDFTDTSGTADNDFKKLINNTVCWLANKTNYAPTLSNASVTPENGSAGDTFNYTVCYTNRINVPMQKKILGEIKSDK